MFSILSNAFSRESKNSQGASNRPDSGFYGSRESTMEVDGLASSMAGQNSGLESRPARNRGSIVLTAGLGTQPPGPEGQGIPGMISETVNVRPGVGVDHTVSIPVRNHGSFLGTITISNDRMVPSTMTINVRNSFKNNRNWPIRVNTNATVEDLMALIQKELGVPPDQQRLLFAGKQLQQGCTLQSYGLEDGSRVDLLGRLRGG